MSHKCQSFLNFSNKIVVDGITGNNVVLSGRHFHEIIRTLLSKWYYRYVFFYLKYNNIILIKKGI